MVPTPKTVPHLHCHVECVKTTRCLDVWFLNGAALQCRLHLIGLFINEQLENGLYIAGRQERMDNYLTLLDAFPTWSHTDRPERERGKKKDKIAWKSHFEVLLTVCISRGCIGG